VPIPGLDTQQTEIIGRNWLVNELLLAGYEVSIPLRDNGVDLIVGLPEFPWMLPLQLKTSTNRSIAIDKKYLGRNIGIAYVLLGEKAGALPAIPADAYGPVPRTNDYSARLLLLSPRTANNLPLQIGRKYEADAVSYYLNWTTKTLKPWLEQHIYESREGVREGIHKLFLSVASETLAPAHPRHHTLPPR
jgi:hypothetical protein